jgi:glycolate oxidase FAD binding subunit
MTSPSDAAVTRWTSPPWDEVAGIVGRQHLQPATAADAVGGVVPTAVAAPGRADEVARALACANRAGLAVVLRGGGTKLDWGRAPRRADLILSTARLDRVREHAWADMTATVEAGATVARLQETLAAHGQRVACDALWPERATVGGILATNDSGPLRARFGSLRDLIIGVTLALPDGTLAKSGGKVVKNVAGYDLPKLATGSFGTLAAITEAVFRLHPLPHDTRTLTFTAATVDPLCELALAVQRSPLAFVALQLRAAASGAPAPPAPPALDVGFEGTRAGLDAQEQQLLRLAEPVSRADPPPDVWRAREVLWQGQEPAVTLKVAVLPTRLAELCAMVRRVASGPLWRWRLVAQALGLAHLRLEAPTGGALVEGVARLRAEVEAGNGGGSLIVLGCPPEVKSEIDVWGTPGDALPLLRRVKAQLDPVGILSPGRFIGGI